MPDLSLGVAWNTLPVPPSRAIQPQPDKMAFTSIPVLDLSLAGDPRTKPGFLADLRHALMEVGFLYLENVGIPDELYEEVIREGKAFFDLPVEEK